MSATRGNLADQGLTLDELAHHIELVREGLLTFHPFYDEAGQLAGLGLMWNEAEVDRRLAVLEAAGVDPQTLAEVRAFHEQRRQAEASRR